MKLTPREKEIANLIRKGFPYEIIARRLNISKNTVKVHVRKVFIKTGASSRVDLIFMKKF